MGNVYSKEVLDISNAIEGKLPDNDTHTGRFEIKSESSNRKYIIAKRKSNGAWECSCPSFIFNRKRVPCKHLLALRGLLEEMDKNAKLLEAGK